MNSIYYNLILCKKPKIQINFLIECIKTYKNNNDYEFYSIIETDFKFNRYILFFEKFLNYKLPVILSYNIFKFLYNVTINKNLCRLDLFNSNITNIRITHKNTPFKKIVNCKKMFIKKIIKKKIDDKIIIIYAILNSNLITPFMFLTVKNNHILEYKFGHMYEKYFKENNENSLFYKYKSDLLRHIIKPVTLFNDLFVKITSNNKFKTRLLGIIPNNIFINGTLGYIIYLNNYEYSLNINECSEFNIDDYITYLMNGNYTSHSNDNDNFCFDKNGDHTVYHINCLKKYNYKNKFYNEKFDEFDNSFNHDINYFDKVIYVDNTNLSCSPNKKYSITDGFYKTQNSECIYIRSLGSNVIRFANLIMKVNSSYLKVYNEVPEILNKCPKNLFKSKKKLKQTICEWFEKTILKQFKWLGQYSYF